MGIIITRNGYYVMTADVLNFEAPTTVSDSTSVSVSGTHSASQSPSPTATPTASQSPSPTASGAPTKTVSATATPPATPTATPTASASGSATASASPSCNTTDSDNFDDGDTSGWTQTQITNTGGGTALTFSLHDNGDATYDLEFKNTDGGAGKDREYLLMRNTPMCDNSHAVWAEISGLTNNAGNVYGGFVLGADSASSPTTGLVGVMRGQGGGVGVSVCFYYIKNDCGGVSISDHPIWVFELEHYSGLPVSHSMFKVSLHDDGDKAHRLTFQETYDRVGGTITNSYWIHFDAIDIGNITLGNYVGWYGRHDGTNTNDTFLAADFNAAVIAANPTGLVTYYLKDNFEVAHSDLSIAYVHRTGSTGVLYITAGKLRMDGTVAGLYYNMFRSTVVAASANGRATLGGTDHSNLTPGADPNAWADSWLRLTVDPADDDWQNGYSGLHRAGAASNAALYRLLAESQSTIDTGDPGAAAGSAYTDCNGTTITGNDALSATNSDVSAAGFWGGGLSENANMGGYVTADYLEYSDDADGS